MGEGVGGIRAKGLGVWAKGLGGLGASLHSPHCISALSLQSTRGWGLGVWAKEGVGGTGLRRTGEGVRGEGVWGTGEGAGGTAPHETFQHLNLYFCPRLSSSARLISKGEFPWKKGKILTFH